MIMKSDVTGRNYQPANCCFILNPRQTALYVKNGLTLLDVLVSHEDKLVYVFDKKDSEPLYQKWKNYELV
ncbi:MAG: hypothetical protein RR365_00990 [Bacteroides sp.]